MWASADPKITKLIVTPTQTNLLVDEDIPLMWREQWKAAKTLNIALPPIGRAVPGDCISCAYCSCLANKTFNGSYVMRSILGNLLP